MVAFFFNNWIYIIGFTAQGIFAVRMAVQWILSERKGKIESPAIFWQLSILGSILLLIYGDLRNDSVIVFGQTLSYLIFIRNLVIEKSWFTMKPILRAIIIGLPLGILYHFFIIQNNIFSNIYLRQTISYLFIIGTFGQFLMSIRFVYQWYLAEKTKNARLPAGFWYITMAGSIMIVIYAYDRMDPVLMIAQIFSIVSASRNIHLNYKTLGK